MKRLYALVLCLALSLALLVPASAVQTGQVINQSRYTDIVAQIEGHPLRSYNVDNRTAVVAEDLADYGFSVVWNESGRTLSVARAVNEYGLVYPSQWPEYTPEALAAPVGTPAHDILSTDIVTDLAGKQVDSFNINGETLIWFSDLMPFGDVTWDEAGRTANLTLVDPMERALDELQKSWEDWAVISPGGSAETMTGDCGTLFVARYTGTSHGTACKMLYVEKNGVQTDLAALMPAYGFGAAYYLDPRDIQFSEDGKRLSFYTPVKSEENNETVEWGDTYCVIDLENPSVTRLDRMDQPLASWTCTATSKHEHQDAEIEAVFTRKGAEVTGEIKKMPCGWNDCSAGTDGITIQCYPYAGSCEFCQSEAQTGADFSWIYDAPAVMEPDFVQDNFPELREKLAQHFQVTWNGQPVTGDLWRSQGNGHVDYHFTFDQPVRLSDGDVLRVWMK